LDLLVIFLWKISNLAFGLKVLGLSFFCGRWRVEIDVGNLGWSVVVLEWVFATPLAISNMVDLLTFEASFLGGCRNSITLNALLYALTHYHNVSELPG